MIEIINSKDKITLCEIILKYQKCFIILEDQRITVVSEDNKVIPVNDGSVMQEIRAKALKRLL